MYVNRSPRILTAKLDARDVDRLAISTVSVIDAAAATSSFTITSTTSVRFSVNDAPWADLHYRFNGGDSSTCAWWRVAPINLRRDGIPPGPPFVFSHDRNFSAAPPTRPGAVRMTGGGAVGGRWRWRGTATMWSSGGQFD